jgi:selenide,water dikinase
MNNEAAAPLATDLLLIGGGHSHALVLRMLGMDPMPGVRVTVVSEVSHAPYSGMLPGHIAGHYTWDEMHIDLRRLCEFAKARFVHGSVTGIDLERRRAIIDGRPPLAFETVSINTGSLPAHDGVAGADHFATPAKPVPRLLEKWTAVCEEAAGGKNPRLVIVGGGAGGVELALAMQARLASLLKNPEAPEITLLHADDDLLPGHNARVRRLLTRELASRGVHVCTGRRVIEVRRDAVVSATGESYSADHVFWVTNASPPPWLANSGLQLDERGFIAVGETLQSRSHQFVFAAGDVATLATEPRPKSGVFAVRAARPLAANLRRYLAGEPLHRWRPQKNFLSLIGTGRGEAVASRRWLAVQAPWCWTLKERIDRKFMRKFEALPRMADGDDRAPQESRPVASERARWPEVLADLRRRAEMRCLGCAAKVGGPTLVRVMDRVREEFSDLVSSQAARSDILAGLDPPDDAAVFSPPSGRALVQTVDYLPALVADPYLFARIATLHCFSDIFAMGAEPHSALLTALVPFSAEPLAEETLYQVVSGVLAELKKMNAVLLGGHSAEGAILGAALTCNGVVDPDAVLRKSGLTDGQALILTKPLGIGTLFAANMRLDASGLWIEAAIDSMLQSNQSAARVFREHGVTAATDVTGFGLLGHLLEMLRASKAGALLDLDALPLLPGALDCAARGLLSSIHPPNSRAGSALANAAAFASHPRLPMLFDPQTSGGLLGALPPERAPSCVAALHAAGCRQAAVIGRVVPPDSLETPVRLSGS